MTTASVNRLTCCEVLQKMLLENMLPKQLIVSAVLKAANILLLLSVVAGRVHKQLSPSQRNHL